jgi:hypothetical protein
VVKAYLQNHETEEEASQAALRSRVTFQLPHHVEYGQDMCLIGEDPALGEWDVTKCVPMAWHDGDYWTAEAELPAGSKVEYKYVVRAAEDKGGDVLEWQPTCWNLAVQAEAPELTIRDAWEGDTHEILEGSLPLPEVPLAEATEQDATAPKTTTITIHPIWVDSPPPTTAEAGTAAPAPAVTGVSLPAPTAAYDFPTVFDNTVDPPLAAADDPMYAEDVASNAGAAVLPETSSLSDSDSGVLTAEQIAAPPAPKAARTADSSGRKLRRGFAEDQNPKAFGGQGAVAAASSFKGAADWASLPTVELKQLCKERGLSSKGPRKDLLIRLQQHEA